MNPSNRPSRHGRLTLLSLAAVLATATSAGAQMGGGGGHGGHGGRGGQNGPSPAAATPSTAAPASTSEAPLDKLEIVGVIKSLDLENQRITIAYEPVELLNWPAGTQPFAVGKTDLMKGLTVGERVRFKLESQQISAIRAY